MPWFQEFSLGQALAHASPDQRRLGFLEGIADRSANELCTSFRAVPLIDDPRYGRIDSQDAFRAYIADMKDWVAEQGSVDPVALTESGTRRVEEVSVKLPGPHPELPVAVVTQLATDRRIAWVRVYHSLWPLTGGHRVRPPLLEPDASIVLDGAPDEYQRALAAGDADAIIAAFEPEGTVREPAGGPYSYRGAAHRAIYDTMFANGGGIPLQFCTVTDDGRRCAIEYNCVRWGKDAIPPQAGIAVYERGASGRLAAARIYDDVTPPAVSDSTARLEH